YRTGVNSAAMFRIMARDESLGSFTLHFDAARELMPSETQLLETLGQHLGVTLDHRRLEAKARQLAVIRERSLVAQGLHDSIAQGVNFLKCSCSCSKTPWRVQTTMTCSRLCRCCVQG